jgi:hypothetical protein
MATDLDDFNDLDVLEDETDENYRRISKRDLDRLRDAADKGSKYRKKAEELERQSAFSQAGLNDLNEAQRAALTRLVEDPSPEKYREQAAALGFIAPPAPVEPEHTADLEAIDRQAAVANGAGAPQSVQVTPDDANGWPVDRLMRLNEQHPALYDRLLSGEPITLPQGFA